MALIKCKECGAMISDKARACPKCGCPTKEELPQQKNDATDIAPVYYDEEEEESSHKWRYVIISILLAAISGGGFWWYSQSSGEKEVREFVEQFAKAVETGDSMAVQTMYPDAIKADSLYSNIDINNLKINKTDGNWKVMDLVNDIIILITKNDNNDSLHIEKSWGLFAYPEETLTLAKGTGWYGSNLTDKQNAERLSDKDFVSWLNKKAIQDKKDNVIITKATSTKVKNEEWWGGESGETHCTVIINNNNNFDVSGNEYKIQAREKYRYWQRDFDTFEESEETAYGDVKILSGKLIPANSSISFFWKGIGYLDTSHYINDKFKLDASITFTPQFEKSAMDNYQPTGKEYEEYLAEKNSK